MPELKFTTFSSRNSAAARHCHFDVLPDDPQTVICYHEFQIIAPILGLVSRSSNTSRSLGQRTSRSAGLLTKSLTCVIQAVDLAFAAQSFRHKDRPAPFLVLRCFINVADTLALSSLEFCQVIQPRPDCPPTARFPRSDYPRGPVPRSACRVDKLDELMRLYIRRVMDSSARECSTG